MTGTMRKGILALTAALALALPRAAGAEATSPDAVAAALRILFETPYLSELPVPGTVTYGFRREAEDASGFEDRVTLRLLEDQGEGRRRVAFDFLNGRQRMPFAPKDGVRGNPLVMLFLQRDVVWMGRTFGGNHHYFRIRVLDALRHDVKSQRITRELDGEPTAMTLLTIAPYVGDVERARFAAQEHKRYEFTLSPDVPGGIYQIRSVVPGGANGRPAIEETMTFTGVTP